MKRVAIILEKSLERGQAANISAILMGQASLCLPEIYDSEPLLDRDGNRHAAIRYSTVVLKAGRNELNRFIEKLRVEYSGLTCILFCQVGQMLHNRFDEYRVQVAAETTENLMPVGVVVAGEDEEVRRITRGFSLLS
jgi:hypothetical protein